MNKQIIEYPMDIRNLSGMNTVIFTYSKDLANKIQPHLPDDFQIIYHNLRINNDDSRDWLMQALFYTHLFIVTEHDLSTNLAGGVALAMALEQNPELILSFNVADETISFLTNFIDQESVHFTNLNDLIDFIESINE